MFEAVIMFLIQICVVALLIYLVLWVLQSILGVPIPSKVVQIIWVIVALIAVLWLVQMIVPHMGHFRMR